MNGRRNQGGRSARQWGILPWRLGAVYEFTGTWAVRRNSGSGHEKADDAGTLWVAISVVSSVVPEAQHNNNKGREEFKRALVLRERRQQESAERGARLRQLSSICGICLTLGNCW